MNVLVLLRLQCSRSNKSTFAVESGIGKVHRSKKCADEVENTSERVILSEVAILVFWCPDACMFASNRPRPRCSRSRCSCLLSKTKHSAGESASV